VGSTPEVVAVDPTTQLAFVTNNAGNSVTLLQLDQNPPSVAFDTRSGATLDSGVPTVPSNHVTGTAQSALVGIDHVYVTYVPLGLAQTSAVFGPIPAYVKCSDNTLEWCTFDSTPPSIPGSYTVQAIAVDRTGSASAASSIQVTIV
jgi:hypothetical protein